MLESVRDLCRFRVRALGGKVGKAADFYFDDSTWSIRYLVFNTTGWLFGHRALIHPDYLGRPDGYEPASHSHSGKPKPFLWP